MSDEFLRASPAELRKAQKVAGEMIRAGLMFVPLPVLNLTDLKDLQANAQARLSHILETNEAAAAARKTTLEG